MEERNYSNSNSIEEVLQNVLVMTEVAIELKEKCVMFENYLTHLKSLFAQSNRALVALQTTSKCSLQQAKKLLTTSAAATNLSIRQEYEKLSNLIDRQLTEFDDLKDTELENECTSLSYISEKIKFLESKQKPSDNSLPPSGSNKSVKCDVDEKYPENWSRDSSIDLNNVVNLPPVPEDVFTTFTSSTKPKRSSSLSSLKSMRKVKLFLQKAETSDEEDISSDNDDHEFGQKGDSDDTGSPKQHLGNITEETQDNSSA